MELNMDKAEFRKRWEKLVSTSDRAILDKLWEDFDVRGRVDEFLYVPTGPEDLAYDAEERLEWFQLGRERGQAPRRVPTREEYSSRLGQLERERAEAFEEYLAHIATADPRVYRFRERMLGGRLLTPEQARSFVHSPATRFFTRGLFEQCGIPLVGHSVELEGYERKREGARVKRRAVVRVEPPGVSQVVQTSRSPQGLAFVNENGRADYVEVWNQSVLDRLRKLSGSLAAGYLWQEAQATWFVLTGTVPAVPPVRAWRQPKVHMRYSYDTITLEVATWVPPQVVQAAFREARRQLWGKKHKNRPIGEKNLKLLRFVLKRTDPIGRLKEEREPDPIWTTEEIMASMGYEKRPTGRELVGEWNRTEWVREHPEWSYDPGESRNFLRDYHRARRKVAYAPRPEPDDRRQFDDNAPEQR
jgi:hypothetical protein